MSTKTLFLMTLPKMEFTFKRVAVVGTKGRVPIDASGFLIPAKAMMIPDAADAIEEFVCNFERQHGFPVSFNDMYRSIQEQIVLRKKYPGRAARAGFSGHNYGLCVDIHVNGMFASFRCMQKKYSLMKLRQDLVKFGFTHIESEAWHFQFLQGRASVSEAVQQDYSQNWRRALTVADVQGMLSTTGYYKMKVDGIYGPGTRAAVLSFQGVCGLQVDGNVGPMTTRCLLLATVGINVVE